MIDDFRIRTVKHGKVFSKQKVRNPITGSDMDVLLIGQAGEFDADFAKVFHAFTRTLVEDSEISGKAIRLLFWIIDRLEYGRIEFYMNYPLVKKSLGISKTTYHTWVNTLLKKGIIKKIAMNLYRLNPACIAKGKAHTLISEFVGGEDE